MLTHYWRMALAVYARRKVFTAITVLCITLTLTVVSVGTHLVVQTLYPGDADSQAMRTLMVHSVTRRNDRNETISPPGFRLAEQIQRQLKTPEQVGVVSSPNSVNVFVGTQRSQLLLRYSDAAYWQVVHLRLLEGRVLQSADVDAGRQVAVISARAARQMFGAGSAVGKKFVLHNMSHEVVGVVRESAHMNVMGDLWIPHSAQTSSDYRQHMRGNFMALILARRMEDFPRIREEFAAFISTLQFDDGLQDAETLVPVDDKLDFIARNILNRRGQPDSGAGTFVSILGVAALLFMALPAINLINLNTGRMLERRSEIGVRKAFGARSSQIIGQILFENFVLCLFGAFLALLITHAVFAWLEVSGLIPYLQLEFHAAVLFWSLLMTAVFSLMSGGVPAWRTSRLHPVTALKGA